MFICIVLMMPQFSPGRGEADRLAELRADRGGIVIGFAGIYWLFSARKWFKGPEVMGTPEELTAIDASWKV